MDMHHVESNEVLSHPEMCAREGLNLQRGMYFLPDRAYSILLMSRRTNAPYEDQVQDGGSVLIYEGHDVPQSPMNPYPKQVDQPGVLPSGIVTENGKFFSRATRFKAGDDTARAVRVYEKIKTGIWTYNGMFHLVDAWLAPSNGRQVYKFRLVAVEENAPDETRSSTPVIAQHRLIPTAVKLEVWKRDGGKCTKCGSTADLHFDHIIPFSRGGSSTTAANVQLLCGRHNLEKHDRIE